MSTAVRDYQRSKVYAAESQLHWLRDNGSDTVELDGVALQLEPEARFGDLDSISRYVDRVLAMPQLASRFGRQEPIRVRRRKGHTAAHYERNTRTIAIHTEGSRFAMRELLVLHELSHALDDGDIPHGPQFTATLVELVGIVIGPQTALALQILYGDHGVQVGT